ncbi:ribonuclease H-like protein [Trametes versicolor FP-101664 SS1]|uniref:ribonuclease H-like protein n=1 Tax=Trametes versicolor (strain FP-101664) TaxID=717944 RepID=UPI0004623C67|nr:ribonuclease H-like protein [Trametes versicolor FP-101664 SS1]EIW55852.1 ribonuclease H-like protein [Trametes versicolor FP-101664 SS1]
MPSNTTKPGFYAVAKGRKPGIYTEWTDCKAQILNYNGAKYKKFPNPSKAEAWIQGNVGSDVARAAMETFLASNATFRTDVLPQTAPETHSAPPAVSTAAGAAATSPSKPFGLPAEGQPWIVYTDGSCQGNGKPGAVAGIGIWWGKDDPRNTCERCPGDQTNNRAELIAIIRVLETAPIDTHALVIKTDSSYSINCLSDWLPMWKRNGWRRSTGKPILNVPLIKYADALLQERRESAKQPVDLVKVLGHSGEEGNEGADRLANLGATMPTVPDRDWADLIEQTRARVNMVRPAQGVAIMQDTARSDVPVARAPLTNGNIGRQAQVDVPNVPAVENVINPPEPAAADRRVVVPRRTKPVSAAKSSVSAAAAKAPALVSDPQDIVYGDPNTKISPEEWDLYAACILSDEEFLEEAEQQGVYD